MQQKKQTRSHHESGRKVQSSIGKYKALSKVSLHYKSNCCSRQNITFKNELNKTHNVSHNVSHNSTQKSNKKKSNNRSIFRKLVLPDPPGMKVKTDASSLSCSTHKYNKGSHSITRENTRNQSHLSSADHHKSMIGSTQNLKRRTTFHSSAKIPLKLTSSLKKEGELQQMLNRTKNVLQGWKREKQQWQRQRHLYERKIGNLQGEIGLLKSKIRLNMQVDSRFHNIFLI